MNKSMNKSIIVMRMPKLDNHLAREIQLGLFQSSMNVGNVGAGSSGINIHPGDGTPYMFSTTKKRMPQDIPH